MSRTVKDMRDGRREERCRQERERRRERKRALADDQLIFDFLSDRTGRRVQPATERDRIEVLA
jgi:hypothetical protein